MANSSMMRGAISRSCKPVHTAALKECADTQSSDSACCFQEQPDQATSSSQAPETGFVSEHSDCEKITQWGAGEEE